MINCEFPNGNKANLRHVTVACLVLRDNMVLLGKRVPHLLEGGKWGPLGGFLERGETLIEGGIRETREESGYTIEVKELFWVTDNPCRNEAQNIGFVYLAQAKEQTGEHDDETEELAWFSLDNLPPDDQIAFDYATPLKLLVQYQREPFALPVFWK